jgi:hypothetical protein
VRSEVAGIAAMIVKVVRGITRQRSTTTSRHEVVRHAWSGCRLEENHNKTEKIIQGFQIGCGREPATPEGVRPALDNA